MRTMRTMHAAAADDCGVKIKKIPISAVTQLSTTASRVKPMSKAFIVLLRTAACLHHVSDA